MNNGMSEFELQEYDAATVQLIEEAAALATDADVKFESLNTQAKNAKKAAEAYTDELRTLIAERQAGRGRRPERTLLDVVIDIGPAAKLASAADIQATTEGGAWRKLKVEALGLSDELTKFLNSCMCDSAAELSEAVNGFLPEGATPWNLSAEDVTACQKAISAAIEAEANAIPDTNPTAPNETQDFGELWKEYPVRRWEAFGITSKDAEKLAAGEVKRETGRRPIVSVGDLAAFSTPTGSGYSRGYADVKGIGTAGADRISEAEVKFWEWWKSGGELEFATEKGLARATVTGTSFRGAEAGDAGNASEAGGVGLNGVAAGDVYDLDPNDPARLESPGDAEFNDEPADADATPLESEAGNGWGIDPEEAPAF